MKKNTKSYLMIFCNTGGVTYKEVEDRDPYKVVDDGYMLGFCFFDVNYIEDDGLLYKSERYNYSKNIYFGKRCSVDELVNRLSLSQNMIDKRNQDASYCLLNNGSFLLLNNNDITYDELLEQKGIIK